MLAGLDERVARLNRIAETLLLNWLGHMSA